MKLLTKGQSPLQSVSVLVIEGDATVGGVLKQVLEALGIGKVWLALDGFDAMQRLKEAPVDFVITDWQLHPMPEHLQSQASELIIATRDQLQPPVNGAHFVKALRHSGSAHRFIPVIMMINNAVRTMVEQARDVGVNEVLLKPVVAEDLCDRIARLIDLPRPIVTSHGYRGPCRRIRRQGPVPASGDRRKIVVQLITNRKSYAG